MLPDLKFDQTTGSVYLRISHNSVFETIEAHPSVFLDLDEHKNVVGIEYLSDSTARRLTSSAQIKDEELWKDVKQFMDDGWEGPKGDFSQTDLVNASNREK